MAGRFSRASPRNPIESVKRRLLDAERRRSPFFLSPVFLGQDGTTVYHFFDPLYQSGPNSPKKTGYTGPAPSSSLVNRRNVRLSNRSWVLAALIRRKGYVSVGG